MNASLDESQSISQQQAEVKPGLSIGQVLFKITLIILGLGLGVVAGVFFCLFTGLIDFSC
ncbi:hypothetical protein ACO0LF_16940 [Undibacterium sp. Di27W]|uniref:hypothetical protein n=1 Tax=Undibacterium sp. Di27W TaxID=3413036 RepID=UPI003BF18AEE